MRTTIGALSYNLTFNKQPGIAELQAESLNWLSDVNFMLDKVLFFDHLLLSFSKKICTPGTDIFTCTEINYWHHTLVSLKTAIEDQETHLTNLAKGNIDTVHSLDYFKKHGLLKKEVQNTQVAFLHFKDNLYTLITNMLLRYTS